MRITRLILSLMLLAAVDSPLAQAQDIGLPTDYVSVVASAVPDAIAPGQELQAVLHSTIAEGWKVYAIGSPFPSRGIQITLDALPDGITQESDWAQNQPQEGFDVNFGVDVVYFKQRAQFEVLLAVDAQTPPATYPITGQFEFVTCNDDLGICLPPAKIAFTAPLLVDPACDPALAAPTADCVVDLGAGDAVLSLNGEASGADLSNPLTTNRGDVGATTPVPSVRATDLDVARSGGLWGFLMLAFGAGLAALLTPCVFPMIPLTISFFTKHSASRGKAFRMASVYGLSIVLTFTALGLVMALVVGAAGAQTIAANPWVNLFIAFVLIFFGQIVTVKNGYGRNYLIPKGLARLATPGTIKAWQEERRQAARRLMQQKTDAEALAQEMGKLEVVVTAKVGEENRIFGTVTAQQVAIGLAAQGIQVDRRKVSLDEDIRLIGVYTASVKLHPEVTAQVKVRVEPESAEAEAEA